MEIIVTTVSFNWLDGVKKIFVTLLSYVILFIILTR